MELICHPSHPAWLLQPVFQQRPQQAALQPRPFTLCLRILLFAAAPSAISAAALQPFGFISANTTRGAHCAQGALSALFHHGLPVYTIAVRSHIPVT